MPDAIPGALPDALPNAPSFVPGPGGQAKVGQGSISGLVTDVNGGIVPGATVSLLDPQGKPERKVTADSGGRFTVDGLLPGTYQLKIDAEGLRSFEPPPVVLKDGEHFALPDTALPIAPASQSVDVVLTQTEIAEVELKQEEGQRLLGIVPNFYFSYIWNAAPLNRKQKLRLAVRAATDPYTFARVGVTAGVQQARGTYPEFGDSFGGYATRYAAAYGDVLAGRLISNGLVPILVHQDPRYFYMGRGGFSKRALHAILASVIARTDKGGVEPNYARTLGNFSAGYLARTWHPGSDNGLGLAFEHMFTGIGEAAGRNLLQEFIYKRLSRGTPPFAKGKPVEETTSAAHP